MARRRKRGRRYNGDVMRSIGGSGERTIGPAAAAALVGAALAGMLAACAPAPTETAPSLAGRILVGSLAASDVGGSVQLLDPATDDWLHLWDTQATDMVTDLTLAPRGRRVAYRATDPRKADRERLIVRAIEPDAPEVVVATADLTVERMAGFAWSGDAALLVGYEVAPPVTGPTPAPGTRHFEPARFEIRSSEDGARLWRADGDLMEGLRLRLLGVGEGTAFVSASPAAGGPPTEVWIVALAEKSEDGVPSAVSEVVRLPADSPRLAVSDGQLAYGSSSTGVRVRDATESWPGDATPSLGVTSGPIWSTGARLAWMGNVDGGAVAAWAARQGPSGMAALPSTDERLLALAPGGTVLLSVDPDATRLTAWSLAASGITVAREWPITAPVWAALWLSEEDYAAADS